MMLAVQGQVDKLLSRPKVYASYLTNHHLDRELLSIAKCTHLVCDIFSEIKSVNKLNIALHILLFGFQNSF